jgi:hypothetical protein
MGTLIKVKQELGKVNKILQMETLIKVNEKLIKTTNKDINKS